MKLTFILLISFANVVAAFFLSTFRHSHKIETLLIAGREDAQAQAQAHVSISILTVQHNYE